MAGEEADADALARALERISVYAEGLVEHHEQHRFGEARSWRVVAHQARQVLDPDGTPPARSVTEPLDRGPADEELERLLRRCRLVQQGSTEVALPPEDAHELLERLATELLLWRHSHPNELPG